MPYEGCSRLGYAAATTRTRMRPSVIELEPTLVDGHVPAAVRAERRPVPPRPAIAKTQAGEAGHEVELGRPRVAHVSRDHRHAVRPDDELLHGHRLRGG